MYERKKLIFILVLIICCLYSVSIRFANRADDDVMGAAAVLSATDVTDSLNATEIKHTIIKKKKVRTQFKNACSILEIFTRRPINCKRNKNKEMEGDNNALTFFGITVFLLVLVINAIMDVLKAKEEESLRKKHNPDGERRQSLAEFANKKTLRRESSKFGLQLFQITESVTNSAEEPHTEEKKRHRRPPRPYTRGDSTNSYLSEKKVLNEGTSSAKSAETPTGEPKLMKRKSVARILGARPAPMVRRSSFPALPPNPDIQALMLGHRRPSTDSDDDSSQGRRVRIIRRY